MKNRAFVSVFDKENIVDFVKQLVEFKFEIVSTGGTCELLRKNGINAVEVSQITDFKEMLSGKVKSLHPAIFAGILADMTNSKEAGEIERLDIKNFDMVVVNLYPFEQVAIQTDNIDDIVKNIDIGGCALIRAGAKNYKNVTVVSDKSDYKVILKELKNGKISEELREKLAVKAFSLTSNYDEKISDKLGEIFKGEALEVKKFAFEKIQDLRYGENPHQHASLYKASKMADYEILWGKELSYNNIADISCAVSIVSEFFDVPSVAIVKHSTPCGVALGKDITEAYSKALDCDPISAFGGIIALSKPVNVEVAKLINSMFIEVVVAPDFEHDALEILKGKKNIRLVKLNTKLQDFRKILKEEIKITPFGVLVQETDKKELDKDSFKVVTKKKPSAEQIEDAIFAWKVAKHAKSNSIVIAHDFKTLAIGQGQPNRVGAFEWALDYACDGSKDAVAASDGFFPAIDNIQAAVQGRIGLIIQPGGSIKDKDVIAEADKYDLPMIMTGIRHFRH